MAQLSSTRICSERMQPYSLTVDKFLEYAAKWSGDREIITAEAGRGRTKDLIRLGGEWINPAELEDIAGRHLAVGLAAVIARQDIFRGHHFVTGALMRRQKSGSPNS
jgi:acyl-coenzyme A synthetase/AMP-(fatty) acid ligase